MSCPVVELNIPESIPANPVDVELEVEVVGVETEEDVCAVVAAILLNRFPIEDKALLTSVEALVKVEFKAVTVAFAFFNKELRSILTLPFPDKILVALVELDEFDGFFDKIELSIPAETVPEELT